MENDKKFYWIKLKTNFFGKDEIDFLLSQKNGCQYVVLYQMLCLQTANTNGELISKLGEVIVPYDVNKIVRDTKYFDFDTVTVALELFKKLGLIYQEENGNLRIPDLINMVGSESASKSAIKKREQRLNKKIELMQKDKLGDKMGTKCLTENRDKSIENRDKILDKDIEKDKGGQLSTECPPKIEIEQDIEIKIEQEKELEIDNNIALPVPTSPSKKDLQMQYEKEFNKLWEYYPNKKGKDQAKNKYILARKQGTTYEEVAQGLKNYINYIKSTNIEERYIKHGSTWFNQKCWNDDYSVSSASNKNDSQMEILKGVHNGNIKIS